MFYVERAPAEHGGGIVGLYATPQTGITEPVPLAADAPEVLAFFAALDGPANPQDPEPTPEP